MPPEAHELYQAGLTWDPDTREEWETFDLVGERTRIGPQATVEFSETELRLSFRAHAAPTPTRIVTFDGRTPTTPSGIPPATQSATTPIGPFNYLTNAPFFTLTHFYDLNTMLHHILLTSPDIQGPWHLFSLDH
jgi:hypothetical protein